MADLDFPWSAVTDEMVTEFDAKADHMSTFHMIGEAYNMLWPVIAKKAAQQLRDAESLSSYPLGTTTLVAKAKTLVDSVSHDNNGSVVAGRFVGGNGGLCSRETIAAADALRLELDRWK